LIIQSFNNTRGRSRKRPRAKIPSSPASSLDFLSENDSESSNPHLKRQQKPRQLPQFKVHINQNSTPDSSKLSVSENITPVSIEQELNEIQPFLVVEISLNPDSRHNCCEFQSNSTERGSIRSSRQPLSSITELSVNGAQKAPKISQKWLKTQPNDYTSMLFYFIYIYFTNINSYFYSRRFNSRLKAK
jgi:hypothetical protein